MLLENSRKVEKKMKKIISLVVFLCIACACLVSCGASMDDYIDNLGASYVCEKLDAEDMAELAEDFGFKLEDFDVVAITDAYSEELSAEVFIIECGSDSDAEELKTALTSYLERVSKYGVIDTVDGAFYIIGNEAAVNAAIGE